MEEGGNLPPGQSPPQKKAKWREIGEETKGDEFLTSLLAHLDPAVCLKPLTITGASEFFLLLA